jgi:hypothetical protein
MAVRARLRSTRPRPWATAATAALVAAVALLTGGCQQGDKASAHDPETSTSCGLLSVSSLKDLTGGTKVKSSGQIGSAEARANGGMKCQVFDAATGKPLLVISVNDVPKGSTNASFRAMVVKERTSIPGCTTRANLPDDGYLCAQADQTLAAAATPKRLIRFLATRDARTHLTKDNAPKLIDEVSTSVEKYDAAHS